jgi:hypothetical protein
MNHISKTIAKHPGVLEVHLGESSGVDYRYEVFLRDLKTAGCKARGAGILTLSKTSSLQNRSA